MNAAGRAAIALAVLATARTAAADPTADAERYYNEGQAAYDAKRYDDAIAAWDKSYALSHLPALVYNLAQAHRLHGDCTEALDAYKRFVALDPKSPQRASAEGFIHDLDPCPAPAGVVQPPPPPPSLPPSTSPTPPPPPHPAAIAHARNGERVVGIVIAGVGVAAAGVGGYFGSQAQSLANEVRAACASGCEYNAIKSKDQDGRTDQTLQYVLYAAGGAAIVTGAIVFALGSRKHVEAPVAVAPVRGGAALTWSHAW
jgi:tetratricopeptide (TPR) repeat protein